MSDKDKKNKILFVLKKRGYDKVSYGLKNSCEFVAQALAKEGIKSKVVEVVDDNAIDKEVVQFKPDFVFIEAIWVRPSKVKELIKLHKKTEWFVRIHSKIEFLAHEGMAFNWLKDYSKIDKDSKNFKICFNNKQTVEDVKDSLDIKAKYAPNIYLFEKKNHATNHSDTLKISCFGALREFKNHVNQALAAIRFADKNNFTIEFHINTSLKYEKHGENILKNLRNIFKETKHKLVEHEWMNHSDFLNLVNSMDVGMQVSFSETFNIVAADHVSLNVPIVGSDEIEFLHSWYQAKPCDVEQISKKIEFAYFSSFLNFHRLNERKLNKYNEKAIEDWLELLFD